MLLSDIYTTIGDYIKWSIDDPLVTIVEAYEQSSTRTKKPIITMLIDSFTTDGLPTEYEIDNLGIQRITLNKKFKLTLNSFSDDVHQAEELLNLVKDRLNTHIARSSFFKGDIVPRKTLLGVNAIPTAESAVNESRAILEVEFAMTDVVDDDVGVIETIIATNEINGEEIIVSK